MNTLQVDTHTPVLPRRLAPALPRWLALSLSLGLVACADRSAEPSAESDRAEPPAVRAALPLHEVRTSEQLAYGAPLALPGGGQAWVGIERTQVAPHEGLLVYVLQEGAEPTPAGSDSVGAFRLQVTPLDARLEQAKELEQLMVLVEDLPRGKLLYAQSIAGLEEGRYAVSLSVGELLAKTELVVSGRPHAPWTTLAPSGAKEALQELSEQDDADLELAARAPGMPAAPRLSGQDPFARDGEGLLPSLAIPEVALRLHVERVDPGAVTLALEADEPLVGGLEDQLLARWWINGTPWLPGEAIAQRQLCDRSLARLDVKRVRLNLALDAEGLRAAPGDWVEVEFLHCPAGYAEVGALQEQRKQLELSRELFARLPVASTRVGFRFLAPALVKAQVE